MISKNSRNPKTGIELIDSFFKKLDEEREQYSSSEVIDSIVTLYRKGKLTQTNIANSLDEIRKKQNEDE